ncbi:glycosyltransferase family 39 protein [Bradyrhizobium sp. TZ2]
MPFPNRKDHYLPYFWAILIFLCSRVVVAIGLVFSQKYLHVAPEVWSAGPFWYHQLLQWDSEWYFKIVTEGYRYNGDPTVQQNIVFYPLYPMLARGLATISGLTPANALLLVSNVAGLLAIIVLFKLVREEFGSQLALATIALLSFFRLRFCYRPGIPNPWCCCSSFRFFLS